MPALFTSRSSRPNSSANAVEARRAVVGAARCRRGSRSCGARWRSSWIASRTSALGPHAVDRQPPAVGGQRTRNAKANAAAAAGDEGRFGVRLRTFRCGSNRLTAEGAEDRREDTINLNDEFYPRYFSASSAHSAVRSSKICSSSRLRQEERVVRLIAGDALDVQRRFQQVIVAPHAGFAARDRGAGRRVVPAAGAMVDRVQQQAVVLRVFGQVRRAPAACAAS